MKMFDVAYVTINRHPESLRELVRSRLRLRGVSFIETSYEAGDESISRAFSQSQTALLAPGRMISTDTLLKNSHLKLIQIWSSGTDKFNVSGAQMARIRVANNGGANRITVAEHTLMLMLACLRRLPEMHTRTVSGNWTGNGHGMRTRLLSGKRVGIIGLGNIGGDVARLLKPFKTDLFYADPIRKLELESELGIQPVALDELMSSCDVISIHLHLNNETRGIISESVLSKVRPNALLVNVSRAELVDQDALLRALNSGLLGAVGLDVFIEEPTQFGDPLTNHPNVVCTPHSANTIETHILVIDSCLDNIHRALQNEEPKWLVQPLS